MYTLQKASEGNGINVVLMGDAFSDRQVADGTYERLCGQQPMPSSVRNLIPLSGICLMYIT